MCRALGVNDLDDAPVPIMPVATYFAPPDRDASEEICRKGEIIQRAPLVASALDAIPSMVAVLNSNRQIVATNQALLKTLNAARAEVVEQRLGEAVGCVYAKEGPNGCGTSKHCLTCGAVHAVWESQKKHAQVVRECRILVASPSGVRPLDLSVTATAFDVQGEPFTLVVIEDICTHKRLAVLQRTFFHDVLNTAGCIKGYADYLSSETGPDEEIRNRLLVLSGQLIEDIQAQRDLWHAETGTLKTQPRPLNTARVLEDLRLRYLKHTVSAERGICITESSEATIVTDRSLLMRVLGNMLKNALEATSPGNAVSLACRDHGDTVTFAVNNPEVMPQEVQLQIFQRSFSTKEQAGRGIGTYSMKLFGEDYMGGKVGFTSDERVGTTFRLNLPKNRSPLA
jgi:nitrogen-specific signal transduction histidine kinase